MFWFMMDDEGDGDNDMREMWMGDFELSVEIFERKIWRDLGIRGVRG